MEEKKPKLWSKNFTIITLGTVVSALGNAISSFSIGLIVLGKTQSTFLFAVFMVAYNFPKVVMPMIAGPYLDRFSRSKVIYTLDFLSAILYLLIYLMLKNDLFLYGPFLFMAFIIGSIDSIYQVAYDSLYPTLVTEGNYSKAYSISSMIYPLTSVMVLVAAYLYDAHGLDGLVSLFLFNAITFFVAAAFETQIKSDESQIDHHSEKFSFKAFKKEFKGGLTYITGEKGLQIITGYFFVSMFAFAASSTLVLPYFESHAELGMVWYVYVMGGGVVGRLIGGALQYRHNVPAKWKYGFSLFVYLAAALIEGTYLFLPVVAMVVVNILSGMMNVTSYNIRVSSTQSYVPNEMRGRFNGTFQMICTLGTIIGQLLSGAMAEFFGARNVLAAFMAVNFVAALAILIPGRKHVRAIYNREV